MPWNKAERNVLPQNGGPSAQRGAEAGEPVPTDERSDSTLKRITGWLWGYDFFISYHWASGGKYALNLAEMLRRRGFDCFLDRSEFAPGEDWRREARRALRNTQRLIVVATREAVTQSVPVETEVGIFSARRHRIVPIVFLDDIHTGRPFTGSQQISSTERERSATLRLLPEQTLYVKEDSENRESHPSDSVVDDLGQTHRILKRRALRLRIVLITITILAIAAAVATLSAIVSEQQRARAQRRLESLRSLTEDAVFELHDVIQGMPGAVRHRERLIEMAIPYLDQLRAEDPSDEATLRTLAVGYLKMGDVLGHPEEFSLGRLEDAIAYWRRSDEVVSRLREMFPGSPRYRHDGAVLSERFGHADRIQGRNDAAIRRFEAALEILESIASTEDADWTVPRDIGRMLLWIGHAQLAMGRTADAERSCQQALARIESALADYPDLRPLHGDLAATLAKLADIDRAVGEPARAISRLDAAVERREFLKKDEPYDAINLYNLANLHFLRGDCLSDLLKYQEAAAAYKDAADAHRLLQQREPEIDGLVFGYATALERLGAVYVHTKQWHEALDAYEESKDLRERLVALAPDDLSFRFHLAIAIERLAHTWWNGFELPEDERGELVEAPYREALAIRRSLLEREPESLKYRRAVSASMRQLGRYLIEVVGPGEEAIALLRGASSIQSELHDEYPENASFAKDAAVAQFLLADAMIAADDPADRILQRQRCGLAILEAAIRTFPERTDLLRSRLVAERRIADFLRRSARESEDPIGSLEAAIHHYQEALAVIVAIEAAGAQMPNLEAQRGPILEAIESIQHEISDRRKG